MYKKKFCKDTVLFSIRYRILPYFTASYICLPIFTVSYRFLPIFTDSGVLLRSMGEEGAAENRQGSSVSWEAVGRRRGANWEAVGNHGGDRRESDGGGIGVGRVWGMKVLNGTKCCSILYYKAFNILIFFLFLFILIIWNKICIFAN